MSVSDWISAFSSFAAFLTASVGLFTLFEMGKQRRQSYKPDIVISSQVISAYKGSFKADIASSWSYEPQNIAGSGERYSNAYVSVYNIGNGAAKDVKIVWDYDIDDAINIVNSLAQKKFLNIHCIKDDDLSITFQEKDGSVSTIFLGNDIKKEVDYILPSSVSSSSTKIYLPHSFISIYSMYYYILLGDHEKNSRISSVSAENRENIEKIAMKISYTDISGEKHSERILLNIGFSIYRTKTDEEDPYIFKAIIRKDSEKGLHIS